MAPTSTPAQSKSVSAELVEFLHHPAITDIGPVVRPLQKDAKSMNFSALPTFASKEDERRQGLEDLAGALRIFGRMGFTEGISGHCTLRDPILTDHFWVNPLALDFGSMTVSDLLLISPEGEIVMGGKADRQQ